MEKQTVLLQIIQRLNDIGVFPEKQPEADIIIDCEFLDASWGAGKKKIEYNARATIDEAEGVLYFWEFTKDIGSGFSFGSDSEKSFQSGTTLMRKVKSVHYSADGKAYEYNLDLGAITKSFKEVAKANGLKFKVVLKKEKASYAPGVTGFRQADALVFEPQQPTHAPTQPELRPQQKTPSTGTGVGIMWWIVFGILGFFYLLFFGFGGVSMIGWILGAAALAAVFFMKKKTTAKGILASIITGVIAIVVLFLIFMFTLQGTSEADNASITDQNPSSEASLEQQAQPAFYMGMLGRYLRAAYAYNDFPADMTAQVSLFGQVNMSVNGNAMDPAGYVGNKVSRIYLTNFEVVTPPVAGSAGFYTMGPTFATSLAEREARKMPDLLEITIKESYDESNPVDNIYTNDFGSGQMSFMFCVYDLGILAPEDFNGDNLSPLKRQNLTSNDLRSTIAFDIVVETNDGQIFVNHIEKDMIEGDFLNTSDATTSVDDQFGTDYKKMPFIKQ
ncbi:MAG: hypothetical protein EOM59_02635 [Clostridia bacterium]|nr:hypothetical protein [Clostridia bacterium]